ncbi:hypothetical protein HHK36_023069 [Tetracentron sinense]|uniref:Jacalin-type lectin domain-containing protein n=1 Tax=Tetracentron sinense TaxID=13715 RepID=A0A834YR62_TETSI|nr:hypothetical protein HHK36_023069 [Tetracentron sinense]
MIKMNVAGSPHQGDAWDDGGKNEIIHIFISHGIDIDSIQFMYVDKEKVVPSKRLGRATGITTRLDTVDFDYPSEFLTWVSGSFDEYHPYELKSITFGTNQGTYGPFGVQTEREFCFRMGDRRTFAGFHGTHDMSAIYSIGVYVKPPTIVNSGIKPGPTLPIKEEK